MSKVVYLSKEEEERIIKEGPKIQILTGKEEIEEFDRIINEAFKKHPNIKFINDSPCLVNYGLIYKATNTKNGKSYIGLTSGTLEKRKAKHLKGDGSAIYFQRALRKEPENFIWEILQKDFTFKEDLGKAERYYIKKYNTLVPNGYNISDGGFGGYTHCGPTHSDEQKKKWSEERIPWNKGKKWTDEQKKNMKRGDENPAKRPEVRQQIREKNKISQKERMEKMSPEEKSQKFGSAKNKVWLYKEENGKIITIYPFKDELENYLSNGWIKGRFPKKSTNK